MKVKQLFFMSMILMLIFSACSKDGVDGIDGVNGRDGVDGIDGVNGEDGVDGEDGIDGEDGVDATGTFYITLTGDVTNEEAVAKIEDRLIDGVTQIILIQHTTQLTEVDLSRLSEAVSIEISNNDNLEGIYLPDLKRVADNIYIHDNPKLVSLQLDDLDFLESLTIVQNPELSTIILNKLTDIEYLSINNAKSSSIDLSSLIKVRRTISISENPNLTEILVPKLVDFPEMFFNYNKLSSQYIDELLERLASLTPAIEDKRIQLNSQDPLAAPTQVGLDAIDVLELNGNIVTTD